MRLDNLVETSRRIADTTKRLEKVGLLAELLRKLEGEEIEIGVAYLSGRTRQGRIGIGYATIRDAATSAAETPNLKLIDVDRAIDAIAAVEGSGSEQRKRELLRTLFARGTREEQHFMTRLLLGELRQGALEGLMLDSLARASGIPAARIRRAAMMAGDSVTIARAALEQSERGLSRFDVQLFRPVQPMLAQTAEDVAEALDELGEAALEYKFDGARVQAHKSGADVIVFSRGSNDVSEAIPEIVEGVRALPAQNAILDGEVLSLDAEGRPQPFQITMRRFGRRLDVDRMAKELPVVPFWFDAIYLNGGPLIDEPQARRFAALEGLVPPGTLVPHVVTANRERAEDFVHEALQRGHEGVMAKSITAGYAAGARGQSWLKIKKPRTLDLIVLAAEWGNGRRQGWLSNLHLGARDTQKGGFAMLGKTFKGLTDEMLAWQTQELLKLEIARDSYTVHVEPKLVVEIAFNEIQVSPRYARGLALRFARVKRYRPDKSAAESDTFETVQRLAGMA
ncbi:MAG: ATP-dependent DNA ligase [Acidobacteriaceae bacterium]|nr:ATP-dependent DNA ligase [Acidobacteriaceae bacterium]MBV9781480.1 ATP-dependent DNA ligase [Acidobacteriaceae bacterium]